MLNSKKLLILTSVITLLPLFLGLALWSQLPEQMPIHWNAAGDPDDWASRGFAVFGMPCILLAVHWSCILVSRLEARKRDIHSKALGIALWSCPCVSVLCCVLVLGTGLGFNIPVEKVVPVFVGVGLILIGNYLPKCRPSHTLGIKLPWTLASEENWVKTHRLAGPLWMAGGLAIIVTGLLGLFWAMLAVMLVLTLVPVVYSWRLSRKEA